MRDNLNFKYLLRFKSAEDSVLFVFQQLPRLEETRSLITELLNTVLEKSIMKNSFNGSSSKMAQNEVTVKVKGT